MEPGVDQHFVNNPAGEEISLKHVNQGNFVSLILWARSKGYETFNLGLRIYNFLIDSAKFTNRG